MSSHMISQQPITALPAITVVNARSITTLVSEHIVISGAQVLHYLSVVRVEVITTVGKLGPTTRRTIYCSSLYPFISLTTTNPLSRSPNRYTTSSHHLASNHRWTAIRPKTDRAVFLKSYSKLSRDRPLRSPSLTAISTAYYTPKRR